MNDMLHPPFPIPKLPADDNPLADLLAEFVQCWINEIDDFITANTPHGDTASLFRLGHTIKGSFLQFGFDAHATIGEQIMLFAERNDWGRALTYLDALLQMLRSLQNQF